jgi:lipopolysaccharide export system permease protein
MLVYSNRRNDEKRARFLSLIGRYIFRQTLVSTTIVIAVLLLIFMSNQFADTLADAAADALPRHAVLRVFGLQFVQYLPLLTPIGILLGILLAMARLNRDSEMTVLAACGIGPTRLLGPIGLLSLMAAGVVAWLALVQAPTAMRDMEQIRFAARAEMELGALTAGRFSAVDSGSTIVYAADAVGDILKGVFIESESDGKVVVIVAEEGERLTNSESGEALLELRNGKRYAGVPGEAKFTIDQFGRHGIPIRLETTEFVEAIEALPTSSLIGASDPEVRAELARRISAPLSILVLTLLAVPLGRSSPREGKYARFGVGLLIYIIYADMLSIAQLWVAHDTVPRWLGIWWVHAVLAMFALGMLYRQTGFGVTAPVDKGVRLEPTG